MKVLFDFSRPVSVLALMSLFAVSCSAPPPAPRGEARLVLLYATCTVNRDHLSPYNSDIEFTPNLSAFADRGVVFGSHHTEAGQSGVAYASLFSGRQAMGHGIFFHPTRIAESVELISEAFASAGYETFFWADHSMASPDLNFAQGIPPSNLHWKSRDPFDPEPGEHFLKAGDPDLSTILEELRADPEYKAYVMTNFTVTHGFYSKVHLERFCRRFASRCQGLSLRQIEHYREIFAKGVFGWMHAPEDTKKKFGLSDLEYARLNRVGEILYQSNIFYLDGLFGALVEQIEAAGLLDESAIAFTADHGEVLHRETASYHWSHGFELAPEVINVPWLLRAPGLEPQVIDAVTRSVDVFPTLLGLAGIETGNSDRMGVDLSPALLDREPMPLLLAYSHTALAPLAVYEAGERPALLRRFPERDLESSWIGVRDGDLMYKLTSEAGEAFSPSVYDWRRDRVERNNLYEPSNPTHTINFARLKDYRNRLIAGYRAWQDSAPAQLPSQEREELLRSLGYIK